MCYFFEQLGMGSCPLQIKIIGSDSVNEKPIRLDMTISMTFPVSD